MSIVYSHSINYSEGELRRNPEMDHPQQHCHQYNSGLTRYPSDPSSLITSLVENNTNHGCVNEEPFRSEDHQQHYASSTKSSEMDTMLAKLIASPSNNGLSNSELLHHEFGASKTVKEEAGDPVPQRPHHNNGYSYGSQPHLVYQSQQIQGLTNGSVGAVNAFDGSFSSVTSNLIRQKSFPAGFFNNYSVDNGLVALRDVGSFRACDVSNGQATTTSTSGLHNTLNFTSRMPQIAENGNEGLEATCVESRSLGNDNGNTKCYMPSFTNDFWDGSAFNAHKTANNNGEIMFSTSNAMDTQDEDFGYQKLGLTHHTSLPSSTKMSGMEKLYQIQGSVPWKVRAKRGFATHPRSIAERERRTRISSRMKKLQDLFPKSDKQTSTADMLDVAVEYIKDLKKQVKILTNTKAKCICSSNQKQYQAITTAYYRCAIDTLLAYDITKHPSFDHVGKWQEELQIHADKNMIVMLVVNKSDLSSFREVLPEVAKNFAQREGLFFIETTALDSNSVDRGVSFHWSPITNI